MIHDRVVIDYTNYRGERSKRLIQPHFISFRSSQFHTEMQWLLAAVDIEKNADRDFAMKDIHSWEPAP